MDEPDMQLHRSDVPLWYNGTLMKWVFVAAGVSMLYGSFFDSNFADGRPGVVDGIIGLAVGVAGGMLLGRSMVTNAIRVCTTQLSLWGQWWNAGFGVSKLVFFATFFPCAFLPTLLCVWLSHALGLGWPWFHGGGAGVTAVVAYCITASIIMDRWYRTLPE